MTRGRIAGPLSPTFHGFVSSEQEALSLFDACLRGELHFVDRRPYHTERSELIRSGNVFIYHEEATSIKRWTDSVAWSASRILGDFLIYRELEKPFPSGEKRSVKRQKRQNSFSEPCSYGVNDSVATNTITPLNLMTLAATSTEATSDAARKKAYWDLERSLVGSLIGNYAFRANGLIKMTMIIGRKIGPSLHMVSYYKPQDIRNGAPMSLLHDSRLRTISTSDQLHVEQNFCQLVSGSNDYRSGANVHNPAEVLPPWSSDPFAMRSSHHYSSHVPVRPDHHYGALQYWGNCGMPPYGTVAHGHATAVACLTGNSAAVIKYGHPGSGSHAQCYGSHAFARETDPTVLSQATPLSPQYMPSLPWI